MSEYTTPVVVELGSIAGFTNDDFYSWDIDGKLFMADRPSTPHTS